MPDKNKLRRTRYFATRISLLYILFGSLWILFSDSAMFWLFEDRHQLNNVSTSKGWFFITSTGIMLYLLVKREISKRNLIEDQLKAARDKAEESENLKTAFLNNISHEIRTPMNAIVGFTDLMAEPNISDDQKKTFQAYIKKGVTNLLATIEDIILVSTLQVRQYKLDKSRQKLHVFLSEWFDFQKAQLEATLPDKKLTLDLKLEDAIANEYIFTDFTNLRQVLNRLVNNAIKFSDKGVIEIGCEKMPANEILFSVKDQGFGIPPEKKDVIFSSFRQVDESLTSRRTDGPGLGLAIARGLVDLMHGRIWFESVVGKGSTFYFTIPLLTDATKEEGEKS